MPFADKLSWKGVFFQPSKKNEQLPGLLTFDRLEGIKLDLFGHFDDYRNPSSTEDNILLGFTVDGKKVTLLNCHIVSMSTGFPGIPESQFEAVYLFIGKHFDNVSNINFDECLVEYKDLNYWLDISGFDRPTYDDESKEVTVKYRQPPKIPFNISENIAAAIEFGFFRPSEFFLPKSSASISQVPRLALLPSQQVSWKILHEAILSFSKFLAICYFGYPITDSIVFIIKDEPEGEGDDGLLRVELLYGSGEEIKKYRDHTHRYEFLLQFKDFGSGFQHSISEWYGLCSKIEATISSLTEALMQRSAPAESRFTSRVQAIENMHRRLYGGDVSLLIRLRDMISKLPAKVKDALLGNEINFEERVKDNRNFYTHHSVNKTSFVPASLSELFLLSEKLKIILIVLIMKELGFSDSTTEEIIIKKGAIRFNHVISINSSDEIL